MQLAETTKQAPGDVEATLLRCAAELILERGQRDVDIKKLAEKAHVPRSSIYTHFGNDGDVKEAIVVRILKGFLVESAALIGGALATVDPRAASPIERLAAVFRATMASFKRHPLFGRVVLAHLNLRRKEEASIVLGIFERVDNLIHEARKGHQLAAEPAKRLADWKIRQVIFVAAHGLLRALYLGEGAPSPGAGPGELSETDVEIEVLRVLQMYCSKDAAEKIQRTIEAIAS